MDLKELESGVNPKTHWYYQSKKKPLFKFFEKEWSRRNAKLTVVDFGSGSGFFAYELDEAYADKIEKIYLVDIGYSEQELNETRNLKIQKVLEMPKNISNGIVILMDVLEHIEDDVAIAKLIAKEAKGSSFFITVPAFMSLWSGHDVYLGHYRRYTISLLENHLNGTGFKVKNTYYIYFLLFFAAYFVRKIVSNNPTDSNNAQSDMKPVNGLVNSLLLFYNKLEMNFTFINKFRGLTCVAEGIIE